MPATEIVSILREGVVAWRQWRAQHPNELVDLSKADLGRLDLPRADLRGLILRGVSLREATLTEVDLSSVTLSGADLSGAALDYTNFTAADLRGAYLIYASAPNAVLRHANLNGANLTGADLQGADLESSILLETVLVDTNLSGAKGLHQCDMPGPSMIDHRTVVRSPGLPVGFLRGCGLTDELINAYTTVKFGFPSCFISYSSKDEIFARLLYSSLQNKGVRCWFAPEDLPIGGKIRPTIEREICHRDRVLLVLSAHSIESSWVEKEVETAFERAYNQKNSVFLPIRLDDAVLHTHQAWAADIRRTIHIGDFRNWQDPISFEQACERLVRDLQSDRPEVP